MGQEREHPMSLVIPMVIFAALPPFHLFFPFGIVGYGVMALPTHYAWPAVFTAWVIFLVLALILAGFIMALFEEIVQEFQAQREKRPGTNQPAPGLPRSPQTWGECGAVALALA